MTKRIILTSLFALCLSFAVSAQKPEKMATIVLDSTHTNIGTFPKSASTKTVVFTFKNAGNDKLVFYDAAPDCGCITVQMPEKPIKPGKKGKIVVTYKGINKKPTKFTHKIYFAVSGKPSHFILRVSGEMTKN